ncbi:hypothetical protein [Hydrogenimonas sp.]
MQALLIFLAAVAVLVVLGLLFPTKTHKTPQNSRDLRQGSTTEWLDGINATNHDEKR